MKWAVEEGRYEDANGIRKETIGILKKIEKRSAKLIEDETKKLIKQLSQLDYKVTKK